MGDGRYYSYDQFVGIICLTLLIVFIIVNLMIDYYKGKSRVVFALYVILGSSVFLNFIETIARADYLIYTSKRLSDVCIGIFVVLYIYLLAGIKKSGEKKKMVSISSLFALSFIAIIFNFDAKIFIYILLAINLKILGEYFMPYSATTSIWGDIKEFVLDYVFIVDDNCKIIYKNNNMINSSIFNNLDRINLDDIEEIFANPSIIRKAYEKSFIKVLNYSMYFQYNKKELLDGDKIIGYIITFTDITGLINMLDNLKLKQEQTKETNVKRAIYKDIVYEIEKEREINMLLEKIANNQQQSMKELKMEIKNLRKNMDSDFNANIVKTIEKAKENLTDVRNAVSEYMNYYE